MPMNRPSNLSRRTVLRGALAGSAAGAVAPLVTGGPARAADTYDCVVVGAGLSGLAAARQLLRAGRSVLVLEARDRPGGRVQNVPTVGGGYEIDGGAEFVGPTQNRIKALAAEYGVSTLPTWNEGNNIWWRNGTASPYPAAVGLPVDLGTPDAAVALAQLSTISAQLEPGRPWRHPMARTWDEMTYGQWVREHTLSDSARLQLELVCTATLSVRPDEISALFMFNYVASAGNAQNPGTALRLISVSGGAQERFFDGGAALVPLAMAEELAGAIRYDAPVRSIDTSNGQAVVHSDAGVFAARRVIVAMSPAISGRISYPAGLTTARDRLHTGVRMGSIGKFQAVYDKPFWRGKGLSGQVAGDGRPIDVTFESYSQGKHFLLGFISADEMRRLDSAPEAQLVEECFDSLVRYFGPNARALAVDHGFKRWDDDPWSWGGPTGVSGPGLLTRAGVALREPVGPIHWAGTVSAMYWQGYMDGAVSSGQRAATEVAAALA